MQALPGDFVPAFGVARLGRAVQHAGRERRAAEQGIAERRLADADAAEHSDMQLARGELVEQRLDLAEVLGQFAAHATRDAFVVEQRA